jgi:flagellar protein FlaF
MSIKKYQTAQNLYDDPRQTEYRIFADVTRALLDAERQGNRTPGYFEAVHWNRRLWTTLQADLASEGNQLPDDLKARLISLAIFVDKQSSKALRGQASLNTLIEVNRNIMEGLAATQRRAGAAAPAGTATAAGAPPQIRPVV